MLRCYVLTATKLVEAPFEGAQVLVYSLPTDEEKQYLVQTLLIDEHTMNSALDPDELGRVEFEANHVAVIMKRPRRYSAKDNFLLKTSSLGLFLFTDKLVIVSSDDFAPEGRVFSKMSTLQDAYLKMLFHCIGHFEEHLMVIHKMSEELEQEINRAMTNRDLFFMFNLEKSLVYYLNGISSNGRVIERLKLSAAKIGISGEALEFLEDALIENNQCHEQANTYSQVLSSLMDARASIISNNLNIRMKTLTMISIYIMLPTLIVSIFSMNVPLPIPQHDTLVSFWIVAGIALVSVLMILGISRVRRW